MNHFQLIFFYLCGKFRRQFYMSLPESEKDYQRSRKCYVAGDTASQIIMQLAGGSFLMTLLSVIGMRDGSIGVVISIGSLAPLFQLLTMNWIHKLKKHKFFVCFCILQKVLLGILFFVPFLHTNYKIILCVGLYLYTQLVTQLANPAITEWISSLIPGEKRGTFFSVKESVAVASTVVMMFIMGMVLDYAKEENMLLGMRIIGSVIILFAIVNVIAFVCMNEPKVSWLTEDGKEAHGALARKMRKEDIIHDVHIIPELRKAFHHKGFLHVLFLNLLWNISYFVATPFNASYAVKELSLSYTYIMLIMLITTVFRVFLTPIMGRKADQTSDEKMLTVSLLTMALSNLVYVFTVPGTAKILYPLQCFLSTVGWCYIGVGLLNIQLKYLDEKDRLIQISILSCISGLFAFGAAFVMGEIVDFIQKLDLMCFGHLIYAQQITNGLGFIGLLLTILYLNAGFRKQ